VYVVADGPYGTFDLPAVRAFIRIFAPRRGEIVVDAEALALRPPRTRPAGADRPRAPRRTGPKRRQPSAGVAPATDAPADGPPAAASDHEPPAGTAGP
jgi:hypothetical protein